MTISTVRTDTKGKTVTYSVRGTYVQLEASQEIRVLGKASGGAWLVSSSATLGRTTWQVELSTTYIGPIALKAVVVDGAASSCADTFCLLKEYRNEGWDSGRIRATSAPTIVQPG